MRLKSSSSISTGSGYVERRRGYASAWDEQAQFPEIRRVTPIWGADAGLDPRGSQGDHSKMDPKRDDTLMRLNMSPGLYVRLRPTRSPGRRASPRRAALEALARGPY